MCVLLCHAVSIIIAHVLKVVVVVVAVVFVVVGFKERKALKLYEKHLFFITLPFTVLHSHFNSLLHQNMLQKMYILPIKIIVPQNYIIVRF